MNQLIFKEPGRALLSVNSNQFCERFSDEPFIYKLDISTSLMNFHWRVKKGRCNGYIYEAFFLSFFLSGGLTVSISLSLPKSSLYNKKMFRVNYSFNSWGTLMYFWSPGMLKLEFHHYGHLSREAVISMVTVMEEEALICRIFTYHSSIAQLSRRSPIHQWPTNVRSHFSAWEESEN